ncbi:MAG: 2Fe-2S iron-sulfur cluster-binding protein [Acidobacteriota bacterium]
MPTVRYGEHACELLDQESALDGLLRSGAPVSYSCKAGSCGSCMLRAVEGSVPRRAQEGLKDSWKARGYFLACVCHPEEDLLASGVDADAQVPAIITALEPLSADVLRVRLRCGAPFEFRPGQYVTLVRDDGLARSYSIASLPEEDTLELQVRLLAQGRMSDWLRSQAHVGDRVRILGPSGECFYVPGNPDQPLLLVGTGTGLAPLYGILRDALQHGHRGPIHLFHGALQEAGLYLRDELARIAAQNSNFEYVPSLLNVSGPVDQVVLNRFPKLAGWRGYLCGDPTLVRTLKKKLFLQGMDLRDIYADAFLPAAS